MSLNVGTLHAALRLDDRQFQRGLNQARGQMQNLQQGMQRMGTFMVRNLTMPMIAAGTAAFVAANRLGQHADQILDLSDATALSTDTLQEFEFISRQVGVNFERVIGTVSIFTRRMAELREEGEGRLQTMFQQLNVQLEDSEGRLRSMDDIFPEVLEGLARMENETERNMIAANLFGRSWEDLAPILALGAEGIDAARQQAHDLNQVIDQEGLRTANEYREQLELLKGEFQALGRDVLLELMPVFKDELFPLIEEEGIPLIRDLAESVADAIRWFTQADPAARNLALSIGAIATVGGPALLALSGILGILMRIPGPGWVAAAAIGAFVFQLQRADHEGRNAVTSLEQVALSHEATTGATERHTQANERNVTSSERARAGMEGLERQIRSSERATGQLGQAMFNLSQMIRQTGNIAAMSIDQLRAAREELIRWLAVAHPSQLQFILPQLHEVERQIRAMGSSTAALQPPAQQAATSIGSMAGAMEDLADAQDRLRDPGIMAWLFETHAHRFQQAMQGMSLRMDQQRASLDVNLRVRGDGDALADLSQEQIDQLSESMGRSLARMLGGSFERVAVNPMVG